MRRIVTVDAKGKSSIAYSERNVQFKYE